MAYEEVSRVMAMVACPRRWETTLVVIEGANGVRFPPPSAGNSRVGPFGEGEECMMAVLGDFPAAAVLRAEDIGRAKRFYAEVVGLKPMEIPTSGS
jgi:hypothetical protein